MSAYLKLHSPDFDRLITLRDAYRIMDRFVRDYLDRGNTDVVDFAAYFGVSSEDSSCDPAALYDFIRSAEKVLAESGKAADNPPG